MSNTKTLRIRYITTDGGLYEATFEDRETGESRTALRYNRHKAASLEDHGNGVIINYEGNTLELDYGQMANLYRLFQAHDRGHKQDHVGIFEEVLATIVTKPRSGGRR